MSLQQRYASRIATARARIEDVYSHRDNGVLPYVVSDVGYWLSGEDPSLMPDDYFTNPAAMLQWQLNKIERHMEQWDDDYIPLLFPWYGTGVIPSALGCDVLFQEKMDPAVHGVAIITPEQVGRLVGPDPYRDGLMPRVLETIRYFRAHSDLPISFTDPQGPFTTALTLVGPATLFVWLHEYPNAVHQLMEFCTELFIRWIKVQKKEMGDEASRDCFPHAILLPGRFGGVWLCDDDCVAISAEHYRKFVVPYNSRVFKEFGGGTLHFCGSAEHQIENLTRIEGLVGVNNFCMGNFRQIRRMQQAFADRIVLMACDFSPLNIAAYYAELFRDLKRKGTIVASFVSPAMALNGGKYEAVPRDGSDIARETYACFQRNAV